MQRDQTLTQSLITEQSDKDNKQALLNKAKAKLISKQRQVGGSSCWQTIFFTWVQPLLSFGAKHSVEVELMPKLSNEYLTETQFNKFDRIWNNIEKSKRQGWTLIKALFRLHLKEWIFLFISIIFTVSLFMSFPLITALNVDYIQNHRQEVTRGILLFLLTFGVSVFHRIIFSQYLYRFQNLGIRLSNVVTMIIYNKALKYSPVADKSFSEAQIINYCEVDSQRLIYVGDQIASFLYGPIQIIIGLVVMYFVLGIAFLSAIMAMIIILFISYFISKVSVKLNEKSLKAKDERMKATEQMLDIIRYIKISAIQKFFYRKVDNKRDRQIKLSISKGLNFVGLACMFWLITPMILTLSFMTFVLLGNDISSEVAFTTMSVVNLFEYPMYSLPNAVSEIIQIMTSLKRIQKFLFANEIKNQNIVYKNEASQNAIEISSGNFYWKREEKKEENKDGKQQKEQKSEQKQKQKEGKREVDEVNSSSIESSEALIQDSQGQEEELQPFKEKDKDGKRLFIHALRDINTKIKKGSFTMIVGDIGSGKSSLLLAILNEMLYAKNSSIVIEGTVAYSPQKPWIMSKTLKENITFASQFSQQQFEKVIHYASLEADLKMLPKGVETQIGQKGINISGGQKARVSLARSLYANRDILLLDDILSAVDVHVGEFIIRQTIREYLKGKTVVMPTHAIKFASFADEIIVMKKGKIVRKGHYEAICNTQQYLQITQKEHKHEQEEVKEQNDDQDKLQAEMALVKQAMRLKSKTSSEDKIVEIQNHEIIEQLMLPQDQQIGSLNVQVFKQFINLNGGTCKFAIFVILCMIFFIGLKTFASILIQLWCDEPSEKKYELYIYIGLNVASTFFLFLICYTIVISGARQSQKVHKQMIKRLLYASLGNFYNRVPTGRIVNRLTKDLRQLDESIMYSFLFFLINMAQLLGNLAICAYTTSPLVVVVMVVVGYLANLLRKYYLKTQMEVSRFEKTTNSPVVSGILSTISGLSTIRAYGKSQDFADWQFGYFDLNKRVRLTKTGLQNWFANTLAFICFFINMPCIAYCMFSSESSSSVIGLLMTYAMYLIFSVAGLIICEADFQTKLVSIQRIYKFMEIEPESRYIEYCKNWNPQEENEEYNVIKSGDMEFDNLKVRYRKDLPDVIKGISCSIKKGQKIGIVGRTGAGKTTIINTLLGVTQISSGKILIDGQSIQQLPLKGLRQSVTMIDQDPTLIKATFRENLDLTNRYKDQELQQILKECNLWQIIQQKGGLEAGVSNNSLSAGQKQLLCICRAFLKHSKIVLIDQATANIDVKNDTIIQKVIAQKFKESTVLTIAHRLSTLQNSDKIMVMEQGRLVQFGSPSELQNKNGGVYAQMMKKHQKDMLK